MNKLLFDKILHLSGIPIKESSNEEIYNFSVDVDPNDYSIEDDILEVFKMFYELEYKYSMLSDSRKHFTGNPQRKKNILRFYEERAREINEFLAKTFINVFENWLENHALLTPKTWAKQRVRSSPEFDYYYDTNEINPVIETLISEYVRYKNNNQMPRNPGIIDRSVDPFFKEALDNLDKMPTIKDWIQVDALQWYKDDLYNYLDDSLEDFNESHGKDFETEEEARKYIDDLDADDMDFSDLYYFDSTESLAQAFVNSGDWVSMLEELYEVMVFPLWFEYWKSMGIEGTRELVEEQYERIKKVSSMPLKEQFATINIATNAVHQTGEMMDYYYERYSVGKDDLDALSEQDVSKWNEELKSMGVIMESVISEPMLRNAGLA